MSRSPHWKCVFFFFFEVLRYKIIFYIILVQQHYCKSVLSHVAAAVPIDPFLWHVMAAVWTWLVASCLKDYLAGVFSGPWQELPSSFDILISSIGCKHCIISITAVVSYHTCHIHILLTATIFYSLYEIPAKSWMKSVFCMYPLNLSRAQIPYLVVSTLFSSIMKICQYSILLMPKSIGFPSRVNWMLPNLLLA